MTKTVTLTIDERQVSVPEGTLVVDAAKKLGIYIPVFCYHPKMKPVGVCRMCLVEIGRPLVDRASCQWLREADGSPKIQFGAKLETGCTVLVSEGMVVRGFTENVKRARKDILEFLLTSHPLDCPVCDKGGECPLQNLTLDFGPSKSRFLFDEKKHLAKRVPLGDLIFLDRERCIQCARCVRFQDEIVGEPVIGFSQRGRSLQIVTHSEPGFDSYFSGNTTDICPVGALTTADFRFGARPWEMKSAATLCPHCPVGCNLTVNVRREHKTGGEVVIKRVMPRQNEWVNELWICDKGRFAYHFTQSKERLTQPLIRRNGELAPATWEEALDFAASRFREMGKGLLTLASGRLSNEDLFNLREFTAHLGGQTILNTHMAGGDLTAQVGIAPGTNFSEMGPETVILVAASDLHEEAPIYWLRIKRAAERGAQLIVVNPRPTSLELYAKHVIRYAYGEEATTLQTILETVSRDDSSRLNPQAKKVEVAGELRQAAESIANAQNVVILFGSEGIGLEGSQALAQVCADLLIATGHIGKPNNGLIGVWPHANDQGAWELGFRPSPDLKADLQKAKSLYIVAADPFGDDPSLIADGRPLTTFLVVQDLFLTATAQLADVVFPALPFTAREGTFTNAERRVQRFYPVHPPSPQKIGGKGGQEMGMRADFAITAEIGKRLGANSESVSPSRVMARIAAQIPAYAGLSYQKLAEVVEQWPKIARAELYYGGTSYENKQGLGVQLPLASRVARRRESSAATLIPQSEELLAVPITRLYDWGRTVTPSALLHPHLLEPYVVLHPVTAQALKIANGAAVLITVNGSTFRIAARLDETTPRGIVLAPRSIGMSLHEPMRLKIEIVK